MKKIKLTAIGLLLSIFSYGQNPVTYKIIAGKDIGVFYKDTDSLVYKSSNDTYKDEIFYIKEGEVLILYLYDGCKKCNVNSNKRTLTFYTTNGNTFDVDIFSLNNTIPISGNDINKVIVRKP